MRPGQPAKPIIEHFKKNVFVTDGAKQLVHEAGTSHWLDYGSLDFEVNYQRVILGGEAAGVKLYMARFPVKGSRLFIQLREFHD